MALRGMSCAEAEQLSCHEDPADLRGQRGWKCKHREVGCRWRAGCSLTDGPAGTGTFVTVHLEKQTAGERPCLKQSKLLYSVNVKHKS